MVGDDGGGNQIGVAPGRQVDRRQGLRDPSATPRCWPSGQWMLGTDRPRRRRTRDATKRPNIINNSWGSAGPCNDPFMEDVTHGLDGVRHLRRPSSNGNSGPAARPAARRAACVSNYVGRRVRHQQRRSPASPAAAPARTARSSPTSRAPGVNVRSSVPGNGYGSFSGTSMAVTAPRRRGRAAVVGGTVAVGDIDAHPGAARRHRRRQPTTDVRRHRRRQQRLRRGPARRPGAGQRRPDRRHRHPGRHGHRRGHRRPDRRRDADAHRRGRP